MDSERIKIIELMTAAQTVEGLCRSVLEIGANRFIETNLVENKGEFFIASYLYDYTGFERKTFLISKEWVADFESPDGTVYVVDLAHKIGSTIRESLEKVNSMLNFHIYSFDKKKAVEKLVNSAEELFKKGYGSELAFELPLQEFFNMPVEVFKQKNLSLDRSELEFLLGKTTSYPVFSITVPVKSINTRKDFTVVFESFLRQLKPFVKSVPIPDLKAVMKQIEQRNREP